MDICIDPLSALDYIETVLCIPRSGQVNDTIENNCHNSCFIV